MALDFPLGPVVGQQFPFTPVPGQPVFIWDGEKWAAAPSGAQAAVLYDTAQSLTAAQQTQARTNIYAAPLDAMSYSGMQINGSMEVSQEFGAAGTNLTAGFKYVVDGWFAHSTGVQASSIVQATLIPPVGFATYLQFVPTTANASPAAGDFYILATPNEGYRISRLAWGTASAKPITISFWVRAARAGNYSGSIRNGITNNRSYAFSFTITAASTWEYKTVTVPGDTSGTWGAGNNSSLTISFALMVGTTGQTAPGTWTAGAFYGATGTINGVAALSDVFHLTGLTVLPSSQAPTAAQSPMIMRPYDQELTTCKRYLRVITPEGAGLGNTGTAYFTVRHDGLRATPTVSAKDILVLTDVFAANYIQSSANAAIAGNFPDYGMYTFGNFTIGATKAVIFQPGSTSNPNRVMFDARL